MGYTHYFTRKELTHNSKKWAAFLLDCKKVANLFKLQIPNSVKFIKGERPAAEGSINIRIGDGMGEGKTPAFNKNEIDFNGINNDAHENLRILRTEKDNISGDDSMSLYCKDQWEKNKRLFSFCKTARKPYDLLVTATLVLYKHHFGDKVDVSGDGGDEGFQEGLDLVNKTLKYKIKMKDIYEEDED